MKHRKKQPVKRDKRIKLTKHHRRPSSLGGESLDYNISHLPKSKHEAFHTLFQNWEVPRIARELNERYIDTEWELIARRRDAKNE